MIPQYDEFYNISKAPIGNFIHNMILNEPNKEVLLFCGFAYKIDDINQLLCNIASKYIIKHIEDIKDLNEVKYSVGEDVHIILIARYGIPLDVFRNTHLNIFVVNVTYSGIFEDVLSNIKEYPKEIDIPVKLEHRFYLKQRSFQDYITMDSTELLENLFLIFERTKHNKFLFTEGSIVRLLMYKPMKLAEWLHQIKNHIYYLHEYKILTARLAIVLYRIANLDSAVSEKAIGAYISKILGITSSQKSSARFSISQCKVYDLNNSVLLNTQSIGGYYE